MPHCASGILEALMPRAVPPVRSQDFDSCALAAESSACSGLPPDMAPVRRSDTKHQVPKIVLALGWMALA